MSDEDIALLSNIDLKAKITKDRYNIWKNGYKLDRWIFQITMFSIFGLLFFVAYTNNFQLDYFNCGVAKATPFTMDECKNPFYKPTSWVNEEYLPPGEYGFKGNFIFDNIVFIYPLDNLFC